MILPEAAFGLVEVRPVMDPSELEVWIRGQSETG